MNSSRPQHASLSKQVQILGKSGYKCVSAGAGMFRVETPFDAAHASTMKEALDIAVQYLVADILRGVVHVRVKGGDQRRLPKSPREEPETPRSTDTSGVPDPYEEQLHQMMESEGCSRSEADAMLQQALREL